MTVQYENELENFQIRIQQTLPAFAGILIPQIAATACVIKSIR